MSEISPKELDKEIHGGICDCLIDVRQPHELLQGSWPTAINIPLDEILPRQSELPKNHFARIVTVCALGHRSSKAAQKLKELGYTNIATLAGGSKAWRDCGFQLEIPYETQDIDSHRYARHLSLSEVGLAGQKKLQSARVALVGVGGLGCPAALYLTAAGIGTLCLIDGDVVEKSNLQRQTLYGDSDLGQKKVLAAKFRLLAQNPQINMITYDHKLNLENAEKILADCDIVVNGSDNFTTRYALNAVCTKLKKPLVDAAVQRFSGWVSVFDPACGFACYSCLHPTPPPAELIPSCSEAGVLGVIPGILGSLQALEVIKVILNLGNPLKGKLLRYNALDQSFTTLNLTKDPKCPVCS